MNKQVLVILMSMYASILFSQVSEADKKFIEKTFSVIENLCSQDNGQMWGIDLNLQCMVVDIESRLIMANKPDRQVLLKQEGNIYTGIYPENKTIASSITEFGETDFAIVAYPFNFPDAYLKVQLVHEIFHMLQDTLGLDPPHRLYNNAHLDELNARINLRLEWEALEKAFEANTEDDRK